MKSIKKKPIMILLMAALMATFIVGLCACGKSDSKKVLLIASSRALSAVEGTGIMAVRCRFPCTSWSIHWR